MKRNPSFSRCALAALGLVAVSALQGCAGYRSYRDGQSALNEGRMVDGIAQLKQASEIEPDNGEYKRAYVNQRDAAITKLVRQAELAIANGEFDRATKAYNDVLQIDPGNALGNAGLNQVGAAWRQAAMLDAATLQAERGEHDGAIAKVREVLSENPLNRRANALLKRLMRQQADLTGKELGIYPKLKSTYRTPVSLSFTGASLRQVFESLKLASGLNYLFDKDVQSESKVTMSFTDKPVEDVLRLILATNQLDYRVLDGDTLLIYPATSNKAADYREMVVKSFYLTNADVKQTANLVKLIGKAKDVYVDERLNLLIVRDSAEVIRLAEKLIASADMAEPEVMLELEVMEVNVNRLKQIGLQWPDSASLSIAGNKGIPGQLNLGEVNFPLNKGMFTLNVGDPLLSARLRAQNGDSNVLANPRIRVKNRQAAKILIGDKVPVITVTNTANVGTSESVSYLDVGLKLDIEPSISLDDEVSMKLSLEVSNIVDTITRATGTQTYRLGTRNTSTVLRVRDGETNVLAGLIQKEDRRANTGIPYLNELPIVSKLFGASQDSDSRTEIVLLVTPHILRNLDLPGVGIQEFGAGTENAVGAAPIQLGTSGGKPKAAVPTVQATIPAPVAPSTVTPMPSMMVAPPQPAQPPPPGQTIGTSTTTGTSQTPSLPAPASSSPAPTPPQAQQSLPPARQSSNASDRPPPPVPPTLLK